MFRPRALEEKYYVFGLTKNCAFTEKVPIIIIIIINFGSIYRLFQLTNSIHLSGQ
jgi:hypothetical protein